MCATELTAVLAKLYGAARDAWFCWGRSKQELSYGVQMCS